MKKAFIYDIKNQMLVALLKLMWGGGKGLMITTVKNFFFPAPAQFAMH
jgi:hypothetical protein